MSRTMNRARRRVAWPVAAVALLSCSLAACGSSAPSKTTYAKQAGDICNSYNGQLNKLGDTISNASDKATLAKGLQQAHDLLQQGTTKLDNLKKPSGDTTAITTALGDLQAELTNIQGLETAVQSGDQSAAQAAAEKVSQGADSTNTAFKAAGIPGCASSGSGS